MRVVVALLTLLLVSGCSEALNGPRIVQREDGAFYIRHAPPTDSTRSVGALASAMCANRNGSARLQRVIQYYSFDTRFAGFRCAPQPEGDPAAVAPPESGA
jgi:putative hemolysin